MPGALLHQRRPAASSQRAPRRRRFCHAAVSVDPKEKTVMPRRAFRPGKAACWAPAEKGKDWQVAHLRAARGARCTGRQMPPGMCCPADTLPGRCCPADTLPGRCCPAGAPPGRSTAAPHVERKKPQGHGNRHAPGVVGFCLIRPICACGAGPAGPSRRPATPTLQRPRWERAWGWRAARQCRCCGW